MIVAAFLVVILALLLQNSWLQVRHARERRAWDVDRRAYVSTALVAVDSGNGAAAAAVNKVRPERPDPTVERPQQIDM